MQARKRTVILLSIVLLGAPRPASARDILPLSDQELAADAAGLSLANASGLGADPVSSGTPGVARGFFGVQTISQSRGPGSLAQAATSLAVRASLHQGALWRPPL
jgi:hypothetical protein